MTNFIKNSWRRAYTLLVPRRKERKLKYTRNEENAVKIGYLACQSSIQIYYLSLQIWRKEEWFGQCIKGKDQILGPQSLKKWTHREKSRSKELLSLVALLLVIFVRRSLKFHPSNLPVLCKPRLGWSSRTVIHIVLQGTRSQFLR